jgi:hypothetical protein
MYLYTCHLATLSGDALIRLLVFFFGGYLVESSHFWTGVGFLYLLTKVANFFLRVWGGSSRV